ncbi:MAG: aromatic amino acid ammonia-lyase [Woeseia sp.]
MNNKNLRRSRFSFRIAVVAGTLWLGGPVAGAPDLIAPYQPIDPTMSDTTITLTGHDLTIEGLVQIARHGAKVRFSAEAKQRAAEAYGLLLQGALENVPIYGFNRGAGEQREVVRFSGDPLAPETEEWLEGRQREFFESGPSWGYGPEVSEEEIVRAFMAARANNIIYEPVTPEFLDMLVALLNRRVTPVLQARGTLGEADLLLTANILGTMVGKGEAYYQGERLAAAEALRRAGLQPLDKFGVSRGPLISTNAYSAGWAGLLVADARQMLEWADLLLAMDLNGMNSSITPLSLPVQTNRPHTWLNWDAARVLDMLKGSYLFDEDPDRIIQDPESLRASSIRQGSAWQAWSVLRDSVLMQINTSDHNPAVVVGLKPEDSWELATPWMMRYYVRGGKYSNGKSGYIVSNANWDPYPLANDIEYFLNALQNLGVAVAQRLHRFNNPYFTIVTAEEVLDKDPQGLPSGGYAPQGGGFIAGGLWQDVQNVARPLSPEGFNSDMNAVGDLQAQTRLKAHNLRLAIDYMFDLMGQDLLTATFWMDIRKIQDPDRTFGDAPTAAWQAFREVVPLRYTEKNRPQTPIGRIAYRFLWENPASDFYPDGPAMPGGSGHIPVAEGAIGE